MKIYTLLKSRKCALPKERPANKDFIKYIHDENNKFVQSIESLTGDDKLTQKILDSKKLILEQILAIEKAIEEYFSGQPGKAYTVIEKFIEANKKAFSKLYTLRINSAHLEGLFRIRSQDKGDFTRRQMFHIPFELRHKIISQRYSIPGYPCLYLGSSIYTCWNELQCPSFDDVYIARFVLDSKLRILDLGLTPANMVDLARLFAKTNKENDKKLFDYIYSKILFFPLLAACSIKVLYENEPFKPEYILPQIVLQYVRSHAEYIDGIRFFSMHSDQKDHNKRQECNYVFPVRTNCTKGICEELSKKFKMTNVLSWQTSRSVKLPIDMDIKKVPDDKIKLAKGLPRDYSMTEFAELESKLHSLPATKI
jgi:hypothetical protein